MKKLFRSGGVVLGLAVAAAVYINWPLRVAHAQTTTVMAVDELESQAIDALRQGHFDQTQVLLTKAAGIAQDPQVNHMVQWVGDFNAEQRTFETERDKEFSKDVADIHKLLDHGMRDYAIDEAKEAYLVAPDKNEFRSEKWVDDLVNSAATDARQAEASEQWLKALRIYTDLTSLDPATPLWKQKLKTVTRRIRLLMVYSPDEFKTVVDAEIDARKSADKLLNPTTQPSAAADEDTADSGDFKLDWHDTVRGISFDMLLDSLAYAEHDYYRDVQMKTLLEGGVNALQTLATTKGLEKTFPGLADQGKKSDFLVALDEAAHEAKDVTPDNEDVTVHNCLATLLQADHDTVNLPDEVFVSEFADGALGELDLFSSMIWPYDTAEFKETTQGSFSGVGIQIDSEEGNLKVVTPLEDTPAYKAGIKAGDIITRIDGKNAKGITATQAVKVITGPAGTFVVLTIRTPDGTVKSYPIQRQTIRVLSVKGYAHLPGGGWDYFVDPDNKIAYLRLTNFTSTSGEEMVDALKELKRRGAKALILDLRYNPGGLLSAAVQVASQFIRDGVIVSTHPDRDTENHPTVADAIPDDATTDMPMAVLVNQYSASASEIVSGALKDHHRADIIGERTFGKGSVQMLFPLSNQTAFLKLTTSHYYLPSGRCLHREENSTVWGVDPDVAIDMTPTQMRAAIEAREQMEVLRDAGKNATTQPTTDLLGADPQLSAALLVLRLKLAGAQM
jgi:carboxyl-terminal processing protease